MIHRFGRRGVLELTRSNHLTTALRKPSTIAPRFKTNRLMDIIMAHGREHSFLALTLGLVLVVDGVKMMLSQRNVVQLHVTEKHPKNDAVRVRLLAACFHWSWLYLDLKKQA